MGRIPARYVKYFARSAKKRAAAAGKSAKAPVEVPGSAAATAEVAEPLRPAVAAESVVEATPVEVPEAVAEQPEAVETVVEESTTVEDATSSDVDDGSTDEQPGEESTASEEMPDYSGMTWQDLRKLVDSEEEASLPDLKKATIVSYLVAKWEREHA